MSWQNVFDFIVFAVVPHGERMELDHHLADVIFGSLLFVKVIVVGKVIGCVKEVIIVVGNGERRLFDNRSKHGDGNPGGIG